MCSGNRNELIAIGADGGTICTLEEYLGANRNTMCEVKETCDTSGKGLMQMGIPYVHWWWERAENTDNIDNMDDPYLYRFPCLSTNSFSAHVKFSDDML